MPASSNVRRTGDSCAGRRPRKDRADQFRTVYESRPSARVNAGGGIEYFLNRTVAVKSEANYHKIGDLGRIDPSGVALTAGLKTYF